ncbi:MAG: PorV/PorQ family protein [Owenweeksia sp.]
MKHTWIYITFAVLLATGVRAQLLPNFGGERAGLSALSFLKNDLNPRSIGLAGASVALSGDGYSILNNPAALTDLDNTAYALSHQFIGAGINQSFASSVFGLKDNVSKLAISVNALNSGEMEERTEFQPMGTGRQVYVTNLAVGATYARQLSALFSAGITVKYIYEGIANYSNHNATVDVAFLYNTDYKDLKFAVMVQNFGGNSSLGNENKDIPVVYNRTEGISLDANTVPTVFSLGLSMVPWKQEKQSLMAAAQLNHPNDNAENFRFGLEYQTNDLFFARAGYRISVKGQSWPTFGVGLRTRMGAHPFYIDYAINPTDFLGFQHSIGLRVQINNDSR